MLTLYKVYLLDWPSDRISVPTFGPELDRKPDSNKGEGKCLGSVEGLWELGRGSAGAAIKEGSRLLGNGSS